MKRFLCGAPHTLIAYCGCIALSSGFLLLGGCGRPSITTYKVPKEPAADPHEAHSAHDGHDHSAHGPRITWSTPEGWQEVAPGEMRAASFRITSDGKTADVGIVPLPGLAGKDLDNVNRWRGQVGADPISQEEMDKIGEPVTIAGEPSKLFDQAGENPASGDRTRILAAILRKDGVAWFFKATGDDELVATNKLSFIKFLNSIQFGQAASPSAHPAAPDNSDATSAADEATRPQWKLPSNWKEVPAGQFLVAKFNAEGAKPAAVNVSYSPGDGGGLVGNVNRWRKQLGLSELSSTEIEQMTVQLDSPAGKASMVDMAGTDPQTGRASRILGAVIPVGDGTWFYKLMGDTQAVEREKPAFTQFITSAKYPNAR